MAEVSVSYSSSSRGFAVSSLAVDLRVFCLSTESASILILDKRDSVRAGGLLGALGFIADLPTVACTT